MIRLPNRPPDCISICDDWKDPDLRWLAKRLRRHAHPDIGLDITLAGLAWALDSNGTIMPKLILSAGVRYDHYTQFGGTANPRLGLIYHVAQPTTLKLLYGTAFRAPEPFEFSPDFGSGHPSGANLFLALDMGKYVNSFMWRGDPIR